MEHDQTIEIKKGEQERWGTREIELEVEAARSRAKLGTFGRLVH